MAENEESKENRYDRIRDERVAAVIKALEPCHKLFTLRQALVLYEHLEDMAALRALWNTDPYSPVLLKHFAFAMLVPGGKALRSAEAVRIMDAAGMFKVPVGHVNHETRLELSTRCQDSVNPLVRFPAQKWCRLMSGLDGYENMVNGLIEVGLEDVYRVHKHLVRDVDGFGPKAAAHFMRNTGLQTMDTNFVPIVDTHVVKFVKEVCACPTENWDKISLVKCGKLFSQYCYEAKVPPLLLDACLWCAYAKMDKPETVDFGGFK